MAQTQAFAKVTTEISGQARLDGGVAAFADDALVKLAGRVPLASEVAASGVPLDQGFRVTLTVTGPGAATSTNGAPGPVGSVSWKPSTAEGRSTPIQATFVREDTAAKRGRSLERWTTWALVGWGVLFALIVVTVVLVGTRRRRRSPTA